jgi:hypothetical protein
MKHLMVLLGLLFFSQLDAQYFGGNPAGQKWLQYNTDSVRIIFPHGMESAAKRILKNAASIQQNDRSSLGAAQRKINLVLQNGRTESNAYVGLAPWRSEFYTTAPQDPFELGAINWIDNLTIHEFRHVQQYSNFNKGFSKFASIILGEQGQALANSAAIPDWFFEGDAVYNETRFSGQGRGKLSLFMSSYKSLFLANKQYSYMQLRNGSFQKYIPNHYNLGYLLVAYGRKQYGDTIWQKITADASAFKPLFYPFQQALKKYTGIGYEKFVNNAMRYYQQIWAEDKKVPINWLTKTAVNDVVDYKYPYKTNHGELLVLKKSLKKIPAFYTIDNTGKEQKIADRSIAVDDYYSFKNGRVVYAAYQPDIRWGNREYNAIKLLDITTGTEQTIVSHSKYFSPDISNDGTRLMAIELDPIKGSSLVILDQEGKRLNHFHKEGWILANPKFSANEQAVYMTARNDRGEMSLLKKSIDSNAHVETVLPFSNRLIGYLQLQGDTLIYTMSNNGRDEIWATIQRDNQFQTYRLASYATGLYQGVIGADGKLVSSAFTAEGYRLSIFDPAWDANASTGGLTNLALPKIYNKQEQLLFNAEDGPNNFAASKYPALKNLINVHSWRPMYSNPEYSFTFYSDNTLNTFHSELGYTYNQNEGSSKLGVSGTYGGTFLQPLFGWDQYWGRSGYYRGDTLLHWNESNAYVGLQLPLNLSEGKAYRFLTFSSTYHFDQLKWTGLGKSLFKDQQFNAIQSRVDYLSQVQQSSQQINPHWGQRLTAQYKSTVGEYTAHQLLLLGSFYLPGFNNNHSLVLNAAYSERDTLQQYLFSNNFPFSRGYAAVDFPRMWKIGANYHLPIAYPEWGFGNIVYFSRIRINAFYDYTSGKSLRTGTQYAFASTGAELYFDTKWWNQQSVSFGIRYSHLLNNEFRGVTQPNVWEFMMPINLF